MDITLQYFDGCPNWKVLDERLTALLGGRDDATVIHQLVETREDAARVGFRGSPSLLVDGIDPFATADTSVGFACRVFQTPDGPAGSPTMEQLHSVLDPHLAR